MTVQEVAAYLRISRFSVYNLVKRGELPAMKVLNKLRFDRTTVDEFLHEQKLTI
jgi:putative molybdopterin biosynthesis protein